MSYSPNYPFRFKLDTRSERTFELKPLFDKIIIIQYNINLPKNATTKTWYRLSEISVSDNYSMKIGDIKQDNIKHNLMKLQQTSKRNDFMVKMI